METLLVLLIIAYVGFGLISFFQAKHIGYGNGISTMIGLLIPSVILFELAITGSLTFVKFIYSLYFRLIMILCGTDFEEFYTKMVEKSLLKDKE